MDIWSYPWSWCAVGIWRLVNVHVHAGRVCWQEKSCRVSRMEALSWSLLNGFHHEDYRLAEHSEHFHQHECTISAPISTPSIHHTTDGGCNAHVQISGTGQHEMTLSTITLSFSVYIHAYLLFNTGEVSVCFSYSHSTVWTSEDKSALKSFPSLILHYSTRVLAACW